MSVHDLVTKLSVIQAINRLGPHDMGLVNVDRVKNAVRDIEGEKSSVYPLDHFDKNDVLPGMTLSLRNGEELFRSQLYLEPYSDDLKYTGECSRAPGVQNLDVMKVALPSGAVLWERKEETRNA